MSQLKLSHKLVQQIQSLLQEHDSAAADPGVASQYLCAVVGFLVGQQDMEQKQKEEIMDELGAFIQHVANDVSQQRQAPPPPPPQEAFGIWKPPAD